jgi:hypothetical protein
MATLNNRFVLINTQDKSFTVYEGRVPLAQYTQDESGVPITAEVVEQIRTDNYTTRA